MTPEELEGIRRSHSTAFYTTPEVVGSMWDTLSDLGADKLERPKVLEPSAGIWQVPRLAALRHGCKVRAHGGRDRPHDCQHPQAHLPRDQGVQHRL